MIAKRNRFRVKREVVRLFKANFTMIILTIEVKLNVAGLQVLRML